MELLLIMFVVMGLALAAISVPMAQRKIKPNLYYGIRVRKTLENPVIWYTVNEYAGKRLLIAGLLIAITAAVIYRIPGMTFELYSITCLLVFVLVQTIALIQSFRYLKNL